MEVNEDVMRHGFEIFKPPGLRRDASYDQYHQFYSYMMDYDRGGSVFYTLCDEDVDPEETVLLRGVSLSKSSHNCLVRSFYEVAEYNSWVLSGRFQKAEDLHGQDREFVEYRGVRLRKYQLDEIERQYRGNLAIRFKKFVLGPVRLDRRYTNGSSLYVRIYPEDYVTKMSQLVAELQSQSCFNAKTEVKYSTDRVYALDLLKQFLESYWNVISDRAKDALRKCIVDIFTGEEEVARLQVYEAAYALMERISLIDNSEMWIPLEDMLRNVARPSVQIIGFLLLNHRPLSEENGQLLQGIIREVLEVGLIEGPPKLRTAIIEAAVKYFGYMEDALAPRLLQAVYRNFAQEDTEAVLSVGFIEDLVNGEAASSRNVFSSNPFLDATVNSILPLARSKQDRHKVMRRRAYNIVKVIAIISLDANDTYFFSEVMERYRDMMNYYNVDWTWDMSLTLSPTAGPESDYAMGKRYACGLIQHINHERPSSFGVIEEVLLNKVEDWITRSSYRDQFVAVEVCAMLNPRLTQVQCPESCNVCPIARRLSVVTKALNQKNSRVQWAGAMYLKDLMGLIGSDFHNLKDSFRTLLSNLNTNSVTALVKESAYSALEALDALE
ncbi:enzymatic polyprotein [Tanacetum coccineum]|uniref:Enzymatic polyprotein n=1 Tax=Tanacetum coccineum TaxID=301880 RepID=A0ABQ4ZUS5_9ASTR